MSCVPTTLSCVVPALCGSLFSRTQVYKGKLDGRPVAVKVQRPDLLEAVNLDFYVARGLASALTRLSSSSSFFGGRLVVRSDLVAAVDEYGSRLFEELDYRKEVRKGVPSFLFFLPRFLPPSSRPGSRRSLMSDCRTWATRKGGGWQVWAWL